MFTSLHLKYSLIILLTLASFMAFDVRSWFIPKDTAIEDELHAENELMQARFDSLAAANLQLSEKFNILQAKDDSLAEAYNNLDSRTTLINRNTHERIRRIDSSHVDGIVSFFTGIDPESLR